MAERDPKMIDDNPEWTEEDFARARPASEVHGKEVAGQLVRRRGRPPKAEGERKEQVTLRLSPRVLEFFREGGEGWQTRIDEALNGFVDLVEQPTRGGLGPSKRGLFASKDAAGSASGAISRDDAISRMWAYLRDANSGRRVETRGSVPAKAPGKTTSK